MKRTRKPWRAYSWAGICCSISRQALIFRRRQTQHKGSFPALVVSAEQTEHLASLVMRSGETDRLACSSRSGGTTGSILVCIFLFIQRPRCCFYYGRIRACVQLLDVTSVLPYSRCFRYLHYSRHVQRGPATCAFLAWRDARALAFQVDISGNRVCANRAMSLALSVIRNECLHFLFLSPHPTQLECHRFYKIT